MAKPLHLHICSYCRFHGTFGSKIDIYTCRSSLLLRYGSKDDEYSSLHYTAADLNGMGIGGITLDESVLLYALRNTAAPWIGMFKPSGAD